MFLNVSTWPGSVICCGSHIPPGFEYAMRNGSAGSGFGAGAGFVAADVAVSLVVAAWVEPSTSLFGGALLPPHAATSSPKRMAFLFMDRGLTTDLSHPSRSTS